MSNLNITKVHLLSVPLENDYKHTIYFNNKESQINYFLSKKVKSFDDFTYQRKDGIIRINSDYDSIYQCNYVAYQNTAVNNKWFYAFIKEINYVSTDVTELKIETDVIQTWLFDYEIKPSFVEREHVSDDTIGLHTIPEGLETGDYVCTAKYIDDKINKTNLVLAYTDYANSKYNVQGLKYGGIYSGMGYSVFPNNSTGVGQLNTLLNSYDDEAKADGINSIFIAPQFISGGSIDGASTLGPSDEPQTYDQEYTKLTSLNGYTPRNKKLLTHPYVYLMVSNNAGTSVIYKQELFSTEKMGFTVRGTLTPGCSIRMEPKFYKVIALNNEEGINAGKFPICCWNSDAFTNWMTSNAVNVNLGAVGGIASVIGGVAAIATGAGALVGAGMIAGGVMAIGNSMAQVNQASMVPDQSRGNTNCGDVITGARQNTFYFYSMSIKNQYARIIDKYFDMFGYKVNDVKVPNKAHRSRYWYTKTIDINIDGKIPVNDIGKIKDCYNNGITFWRNADEIQNYELSNGIAIVD